MILPLAWIIFAAFKQSENDMRHWLMLLLADRVNVVEGLIDDLAHGHVPNLFKEMGGPDKIKRQQGMDVTIVTTARSNADALELLKAMGMPFAEK